MGVLIILVYADDIVITGSYPILIQDLISTLLTLNLLWKILETGHFLRFQAHLIGTCLHLYQTKYIKNLLIQTSMQASKPLSTPISSSLPFLFMIGSYYLILLSIEVLLEHSNIAVLLDLTYAL